MLRRGMIAVALAVLATLAGCGLIQSGLPTIREHPRGAVSRTYYTSVSRVLIAALDSTGVEFSEAVPGFKFPVESALSINGEIKPVGVLKPSEIAEVNFGSGSMVGKTKDGRSVTLWIKSIEDGKAAEATILIGRHGDPEISRTYLDWLDDWLSQPSKETEDGTRKGKLLLGKTLAESSRKGQIWTGVEMSPTDAKPVPSGPGGLNR